MGEAGILIPIRVDRENMRELLLHIIQAQGTEGVCEALGYYRLDLAYDEAKAAGRIGLAQHISQIIDGSPRIGIHVAAFDRKGKK
jgi:hypothetical protein